MAEQQVSIIEIFVRYLSKTSPLLLIFHLFWVLCICSILSTSYVIAFHFTSLAKIYEDAHHLNNFNHSLKLSVKNDTKIQDILLKLLSDTKSNRAYIFRYHNGLAAVSGVPFFFQTNTHEVISPGTSRLLQFYQRIPTSITPSINEKFMKNECIVLNKIDKSEDANLYGFYQSRNSKAMIRCPLFAENGDLFGFIGIDYNNDQPLEKLTDDEKILTSVTTAVSKLFLNEKK